MRQPTPSFAASGSWTEQIQTRFQCQLSGELARWFDDEIWRVADGSAGNRFASALSPQEILAAAPTAIWPALMPCDFIPILSNSMGDWLCVRVAADNSAGQVVHWYHGGGDWIPWGNTLAEAIYFDHVRHRLPGSGRDHAISVGSANDRQDASCGRLSRWATELLGNPSQRDLEQLQGIELAEAMLECRICGPAVLCQLVIDALHNPILTADVVRSWQIKDGELLQRSLFDNRLLDEALISKVASDGLTIDQILARQEWDAARSYCRRATQLAPELAWGWDVLGYCHERTGETVEAIECYRSGLNCSIFTDQTVRVRTHGFSGDGQKFSAARLMALGYEPASHADKDYFDCLRTKAPNDRRDQVREHFSKLAEQADAAAAYDLWIRAGWDLGAEPMLAFAELLEQAAMTARSAGRLAQAEVASTHRACFRDRYGI